MAAMAYFKLIAVAAFAIWCALWPAPAVYNISEKTALVTGASSGLGVDIARSLAKEGVSKLGICARRLSKLDETKAMLEEEFPDVKVAAFPCDIGDAASREALAKNLLNEFGHLDILVNNAGVERIYHFEKDTVESIESQIDINCIGSILMTHQFLPHMISRGTGAIVMMSSAAGKMGLPYATVYSATRFCVKGFAAALRSEMRHRKTGVTVHSIHPGFVKGAGMYADNFEEIAPSHWMFGTGGLPSETGRGVVTLVKKNYPERIQNFPSLRPIFVLSEIFPRLYDTLLDFYPESMDQCGMWAQARVDRDVQK